MTLGNTMTLPKTQVAVLGGGPAGATLSTLLAREGVDVTLFERERFPRFHIGESLMTETWWTLSLLSSMQTSPTTGAGTLPER